MKLSVVENPFCSIEVCLTNDNGNQLYLKRSEFIDLCKFIIFDERKFKTVEIKDGRINILEV